MSSGRKTIPKVAASRSLNLKSQNATSSNQRSRCQSVTLNQTNVSDAENLDVASCDIQIRSRILQLRGTQVMLDRDLAELYGVETRVLNQAVKRNSERFPTSFMFRITKQEHENLKSQFVTSSCTKDKGKANLRSQIVISSYGGDRQLPYVFTEQGVAMLSAVLRSKQAISVSIKIMQAFVAMRRMILTMAPVMNRLDRMELKLIETNQRVDTVFDALDRGNLLPQGILETGAEFDAFRFVTRLVESAKKEIVLIDPYSDASTLEVLAKKAKGVNVRLVCRATNWTKPTATEIAKFNKQYKGLTVERSDNFHDRFVIIDGAELYNLGSSINSLGRRLTTYTTRDPKEIAKVLANV